VTLTDEEFARQFHAEASLLRKIQLAIREERYSIWVRNPPNFPEEFLRPILSLPDNTPVVRKFPRRSGGRGLNYVLELKYDFREMGRPVRIYLKGYFEQDDSGNWIVSFAIQSLRADE